MRVLDLGCGARKPEGAIGLDSRPGPMVDIVHDLEQVPWPIKAGAFEVVRAAHVFEHLKPWCVLPVMDEAWRILIPGGTLTVRMPYPGSSRFWQDPTHVHAWNEVTPRYFDPAFPEHYTVYRPKPWRIVRIAVAEPKEAGDIEITMEKRA